MSTSKKVDRAQLIEDMKAALLSDQEFLEAVAAHAGPAVRENPVDFDEPQLSLPTSVPGFTDEEVAAAQRAPVLGESGRITELRSKLMEQFETIVAPIREKTEMYRRMRLEELARQRAEPEQEE